MTDRPDEGALRAHPYITTYKGHRFRYDVPGPFDLNDIGYSLARLPRFLAHTLRTYSVAQHSVWVAEAMMYSPVHAQWALAGLMHDAHEAYVGDVPSPLKWACPEFKVVEDRVQEALRAVMTPGIPEWVYRDVVKVYDRLALHREARWLFADPPSWVRTDEPDFEVWSAFRAEREFLDLAYELGLR